MDRTAATCGSWTGGPRRFEHSVAGWTIFGGRVHTWHPLQKFHCSLEATDAGVEFDERERRGADDAEATFWRVSGDD